MNDFVRLVQISTLALVICKVQPAIAVPVWTEEEAIDLFKGLRFYQMPLLPQDLDGTAVLGVHTQNSVGADLRSEAPYPPFVLSPRRQTDALVRQLYTLMPTDITDTTAFVVGDRFSQNPEAYLPYLKSRQKIAIAGSFMGIGSTATMTAYNSSWAKGQHTRELAQLEGILALAGALGKTVVNVTYAMGDSSGAVGGSVRNLMETQMNDLLTEYGYSNLTGTLSWGADETVAMSMAKLLPNLTVRVRYSNPAAPQWYDSQNTAQQITNDKLPSVGLEATTSSTFDIDLAVFTRRAGGANNDYQSNDTTQATLDNNFAANFSGYTAAQRNKLAIVDGRLFNGSWDSKSLITNNTDYLAYGGWGTFGNKLGMTLAVAKIVRNNPAARKQLFLEAVAHDCFMGGYAEAQRGELFRRLRLLTTNWGHWSGWKSESDTNNAFWEINQFVNQRMTAYYGSNITGKTFRFSPQFWRIFEADVRMTPAEIVLPVGIYRTAPPFMNPQNGIFPQLTLAQLIPPTPLAPTSLVISSNTSNSLTLTWNDVATNETAYRLQRSSSLTGPFVDLVSNLPANTNTYTNTGLNPNNTYFYRLFAMNIGVSSSPAEVTGTTRGVTIRGQVVTGINQLAGVTITDGVRSATTAADGTYELSDVPAGLTTITASLSGYIFIPGSLEVTVSNLNLVDQDFSFLTPYQVWCGSFGLPSDETGDAAPDADLDSDGNQNLLEYAIGANPTIPDSELLPTTTLDQGKLKISFTRLRRDVIYHVDVSNDLSTWGPITFVPVPLGDVQVVTDPESPPFSEQRFLRMRATKP